LRDAEGNLISVSDEYIARLREVILAEDESKAKKEDLSLSIIEYDKLLEQTSIRS